MLRVRSNEGLGARPSLPDYRDDAYRFQTRLQSEMIAADEIPPRTTPQRREVDAHGVADQGRSGSCVGHGTGLIAAVERNVVRRSELAIYYECRRMIGETDVDQGAYGRDSMKVVSNYGAPRHIYWPTELDESGYPKRLFEDPGPVPDRDAAKRKIFSYHPLARGHEFVSCLASGHVFALGFSVFSNLWDPIVWQTGIVPHPAGYDEGGHWIPIIGHWERFEESEWAQWARNQGVPDSRIPRGRCYETQNSWGPWGREGRGVLPASLLENPYYAWDAWTLRGFAS